MSIGVWTNLGTTLSTINGQNIECSTVRYDPNPQLIAPNPDGKVFKIWASSATGVQYAEANNKLGPWTAAAAPIIASASNVQVKVYFKTNDSTYYLFVGPLNGGTTTGISVYTAVDGVTCVLQNANAIVGTSGTWDQAGVSQLGVIDGGAGIFYGYFTALNAGVYAMGLATSTDLKNWTKQGTTPVITQNGPSNFEFHKIGNTYYGWSQIVLPGLPTFGIGLPSDIARFSATNPAGPWTQLPNLTFYRTLASEGIGLTTGQVADPTIVEGSGTTAGTTYIFFTQKSAGQSGNNGVIGVATTSLTLAQLVASHEGVVNIPIPWGSGSPLQLTTLASDNFNRANVNPLAPNWTTIPGGTFGNAQIVSNQAVNTTAGAAADVSYTGISWPNDQWSQVTISTFPAGNSFAGVSLRGSASVSSDYRVFGDSNTKFIVSKIVSGTSTNLTNQNGTVAVGDVITGAIVGTQISGYQNGNLLFTVSDSSLASGNAGILVDSVTNLSNAAVDNWSGGSLADPPPISSGVAGGYGPIGVAGTPAGAYGPKDFVAGGTPAGAYGPPPSMGSGNPNGGYNIV